MLIVSMVSSLIKHHYLNLLPQPRDTPFFLSSFLLASPCQSFKSPPIVVIQYIIAENAAKY